MGFFSVSTLIKDVPTRTRAAGPLVAMQIRQIAKGAIYDETRDLPEDIVKSIKVTTFKNGALTVVAPRLACVELQMRADGLKKAINTSIGKSIVGALVFRIG